MDLHEYLLKEQELKDLDDIEIDGVPIWRITRLFFRWEVLNEKAFTTSPVIKVSTQISYFIQSLFSFVKLLFSRKKIGSIFFPHPRLFLVGQSYMERFSDSLIDYSGIGEDYLIFERHQNGLHRKPRHHGDKVVYLDFIDDIALLLKPICKTLCWMRHKKSILMLCTMLSSKYVFDSAKISTLLLNAVADFRIRYILFKPFISKIAPNRVFVAPRTTFQYIIALCKRRQIRTIELQHGVTLGETELYSGTYDHRIDPDFFYTFGKANTGPFYGMPSNQIVNIGFPYKKYVNSLHFAPYKDNVFLVISEPQISEKLLDIVVDLANQYLDKVFHIRCHPQEQFSEDMLDKIRGNKRIQVVNNEVESFCALSKYHSILGENSSVLFEAMSLGKKVGRFNYGGLHVINNQYIHGGKVLNTSDDFFVFTNQRYDDSQDNKDIYSDFDNVFFDSLMV